MELFITVKVSIITVNIDRTVKLFHGLVYTHLKQKEKVSK